MHAAVFARPDHPSGYGFQGPSEESAPRAHGYVVVIVLFERDEELSEVQRLLQHPSGLRPPKQHVWDDWYGGHLDLLLVVRDIGSIERPLVGQMRTDDPQLARIETPLGLSLGDNRFLGVYTASELVADRDRQEQLRAAAETVRAGEFDVISPEELTALRRPQFE